MLAPDPKARRSLIVRDLGTMGYAEAYALQRQTVEDRLSGVCPTDVLFLVEHPDVYTFGRKSPNLLPAHLPSFAVERGGEATFHNPGQLVAYPILKLDGSERDLHAYLRALEQVLIDTVGLYSIPATRRSGATGVWVAENTKKIASIGVAVRSWVTYHGVALNVCNDLRGFAQIAPCGFSSEVMTSIQERLGERTPMMREVKASFVAKFQSWFSAEATSLSLPIASTGQAAIASSH